MIELREHNEEPYARLKRALEVQDRVGYESATGTGKSYVGGKYVEEHGLLDKTLILVPSNLIRDNWKKILPGVETMSYQSTLKNLPDLSRYELLVCDEMHHLGAERWGQKFQEMVERFPGKILGMSATPVRFLDKSRDMIEELFDSNRVVGIELPEAIEKGILPSFDYIAVLYNLASAKPKDTGRNSELTEKLYKQLDVMENEYSFQNIIRKHMKPGDHKVAVFVPSIDQIDEYKAVVETVYPDALHLVAHSKMKKTMIDQTFDAFEQAKETCFIYTVDLLNEGAHIDGVDTVIMFRRTESPTVFLQQLGRALTTNSADDRITVFDFVANHVNIHAKGDGAGNVIDWISENVGNPARQVIKTDYAKAEREVLEHISSLLSEKWSPEEDELVIRLYDGGDGIPELCALLPGRTEGCIKKRASDLGIGSIPSKRFQKYVDDIKRLYCEDDGIHELIRLHPESNRRAITAMANRMGLKRTKKGTAWSEMEMQILEANKTLPVAELMKLLPGRTKASIVNTKVKNDLTSVRSHQWSEDEDRILMTCNGLSVKSIRERNFPALTESQIRRRCKELGVQQSRISWDEEKTSRFVALYESGGAEAVISDPVFAALKKATVFDRANSLGVRVRK